MGRTGRTPTWVKLKTASKLPSVVNTLKDVLHPILEERASADSRLNTPKKTAESCKKLCQAADDCRICSGFSI